MDFDVPFTTQGHLKTIKLCQILIHFSEFCLYVKPYSSQICNDQSKCEEQRRVYPFCVAIYIKLSHTTEKARGQYRQNKTERARQKEEDNKIERTRQKEPEDKTEITRQKEQDRKNKIERTR